MLKKVEHIGIAVNDLKASNLLFEALLGVPHYKTEAVVSEGVTTSFFDVGTHKIELLEATHLNSPIAKFITKKGEGVHHIAFEVENLEQEVGDGELPKLIFFGADWCGHCQKFYPTWDKMSSNNEHKKKVKFLKVNCTDNDDEHVQNAMKKYNVKGFPTLIVYRNNKSEEYSGPRSEDSIMKIFS